ncbi:MAG: zinc ABC transporter substrate-binding protein, partial [Pseudomonadota bacterium]
MRLATACFVSLSVLLGSAVSARADVNVIASIKPVHSLVAGVMKGVGTPELIVDGAASPHTYALKPSQAAALEKADVVFWMGHQIESFLDKPLETLASRATAVELFDVKALTKYDIREGGAFDAHAHDDHDDHAAEAKHSAAQSDHKDHAHENEHAHEKEHKHTSAKKEAGHDDHHHGHKDKDAHVWLDPLNAKVLVRTIEQTLSAADPDNAAAYKKNAAVLKADLDALIADISGEVDAVRGKGFVVFHDAYQYFEKRFGLMATGSISLSPEVMPGARRIKELRAKVGSLGVACVFSEPQFQPKLVSTVVEGTPA